MNNQQLTFYEHILEIRKRLFYVFLVFATGSVFGFAYNSEIQAALIKPLGQQLYYTSPMGGFSFMFSISLFVGALVAIPFCVLHIIKFVSPTIGRNRSTFAVKVLCTSILLTACGVAFAYYVSLPPTLGFLTGFDSTVISSLISTSEYMSFIKLYLAAFALIFQIPLILLVINNITPINPQKMLKSQKYIVVVSFIAAAIISPTPDIINQTLMAAPMIILYELSIGLIWFVNRKKHDKTTVKNSTQAKTPFDYLASIDEKEFNKQLPKQEPSLNISSDRDTSELSDQPMRQSISGILNEDTLLQDSNHHATTRPDKPQINQFINEVEHQDEPKPDTEPSESHNKLNRGRMQRRSYAKRNTDYLARHRYDNTLFDDFTIRRTSTAT